MRSPLWFVLAGVIAIAGFVGGVTYSVHMMPRLIPDLECVVLPGTESITLERAGAYTLYIENKSFVDGRPYVSDLPAGMQILLTAEATGVQIKLGDPRNELSYSMGGRSGKALAGFVIDQPGRYRLSATLPAGRTAPPFVLAVGYGPMKNSFARIRQALGGFSVFSSIGIAIAGTIAGVTLWQRTKVRRAP